MYQADLELLRSTRAETLRLADGLTQEQLAFTPAAGKWSAGEVFDHLLLSEDLYRKKFIQLIELQKAGQRAVLRSSFAEINTSILFIPRPLLPFLEIPFRVFNTFVPSFVRELFTQYRLMPAQNPAIATPRKGRVLSELREDLRSSLQEMVALFESNPTLDYRRMRFSHPLLGDNNMLQALRIVALHEQRHQGQIREVMRSPAFPQTARSRASASG